MQFKSESMSLVFKFLLDLVEHAELTGVPLPQVGAYDDVSVPS